MRTHPCQLTLVLVDRHGRRLAACHGGVLLDGATPSTGDIFQMPRQACKRVAKRHVNILVLIVIYDQLMPHNAEHNPDIERPSLALVSILLLDDDAAADDIRIEPGQLSHLLANARGKSGRGGQVPDGDL